MSLISKFRALVMTTACASMAVAGLVSPAIAQNRTAWIGTGQSTQASGYFNDGEGIYAGCDSFCSDIDMYLYDANGALVSYDEGLDAHPYLYAPYAGNFSIIIKMVYCDGEACEVGISSDQGF